MFTGIVEEAGVVERIQPGARSIQLFVRAKTSARTIKIGDSLAVNGCCLTVVQTAPRHPGKLLRFDLLQETWVRTNLQYAQPGTLVNLERPLRYGGTLDGHFVTGHIDGVGRITRWEPVGKDYVLDVEPPAKLMPYLVYKGSIAVDGISLTVAEVFKRRIRIWIIPHTFELTNLRGRAAGDYVNLEMDILGKYVERFLALRKRP